MASQFMKGRKETAAQKRARLAKASKDRLERIAPKKKEICERISTGETMRAICRSNGMPQWRTVYDWMNEDEGFAAHVACAREIGFDAIAQDALQIADETETGQRKKTTENGVEIIEEDMLGHRKLRIETRLKLLACWSPKKYGQRKIHQGDDGADPVGVRVTAPELTAAMKAISKSL